MTTQEVSFPRPTKMANYFVVPVQQADNGSTQAVEYYEACGSGDWRQVGDKDLNSSGQGCFSDLLSLTQPKPEDVEKHAKQAYDRLERNVTLFAGVAKTFEGNEYLPNYYTANKVGEVPVLVMSVIRHTVRGVILIFTRTAEGSFGAGPILDLVASKDPEIKNSTDGTEGGKP